MLIAELSTIGFDGFEEGEDLKAFIPSDNFDEAELVGITSAHKLSFKKTVIEETNWNALWESNFQPVIVDDFVAIRADFHERIKNVEHDILITPKMSFGTGHHATTYMMVQQMREIDLTGKTVLDFGTGTGVLAILAEKRGAKNIIAADNDDWSITNAEENIQKNNCSNIELKKTDNAEMAGHFDIILANINKNIILENLSSLVSQLSVKGTLLLSGLLEEDETDIAAAAGKYPLVFNGKTTDRGWICLRFTHY